MLNKQDFVHAFHREWSDLAAAAERDIAAPLPCCPGWTEASLLGHLGGIYTMLVKNIREGHGKDVVNELEDLGLAPDYEEWFRQGYALETAPTGVVDWFRAGAARLEEVFRRSDAGERTWTWWEPEQTVGFWMRRMANETAIHRWDAQDAHGAAQPVERELALDGIDEALTVYQPKWCRPESKLSGRGESYAFRPTDAAGAWQVRFEGDGMQIRRGTGSADVTLRGSASDLMLFLWHRVGAERLEIDGDKALVDHYFELVPSD